MMMMKLSTTMKHLSLWIPLALALFLLIGLPSTDAKGLRMRVLGAGAGRSGGSGRKPWDAGRDRNSIHDQRWEDDMDLDGEYDKFGPKNFPCVGLCYFMKLEKLRKKQAYDERIKREGLRPTTMDPEKPTTTERSFYSMLFKTKKPCVGLCYYYKKKGEENPYPDH